MLTYKGKELTKFKNKKGGKNQGKEDGFYRNSDGIEYFVKKPNDSKELFTELFAGILLQEFMSRGLIDKIYHGSLICAELIQFEDGSYGLIQPKVSFNELYKIIGTGYRDGSDRDPLVEMFGGPQYYLLLAQLKQHYGLAIALMFSLLLGDNSVHSGNVVCLDVISAVEMSFIQFARIDWGAAFRYFGHKKNNDELLYPFEYQGWFNPKGYTKGYFLNYKKIKGLFPAIAEQAIIMQKLVNEELLFEIISSVLRKLPCDLIDPTTKKELAKYLCIESFSDIGFGETGCYQQFSSELTDIMYGRLKKITDMTDFSITSTDSELSQIMYVENIPTAITLPVNLVTPFAEQINIWLNILSSSDERSIFDFNTINLAKLAKQFNCFMEKLLRQAEQLNQSFDETGMNESALENRSMSNYLRCQFTLEEDLNPHYPSYTEERIPYKEVYWQLVETVLTTSFNAIVTLKVLKNIQNSTEHAKANAIHYLFDAVKEYLKDFSDVYQVFINELEASLFMMPGSQLSIICLNEMEFMSSSVLIGIVLKQPVLWARMNLALEQENEMQYQEKVVHKIAKLETTHEEYILFLNLVNELQLITKFDVKVVLVNEINRIFENLPEFLQTDLATTLNQVQQEFHACQRRHSLDLEELGTFKEESNLASEPQCNVQTEVSRLHFFSLSEPDKPLVSSDELFLKKNSGFLI